MMAEQKKRLILIVDDEANVGKSIRKTLLCDAYEVDAVLSGEEALRLEETKKHEVILLDLMMPGLSGMGLLKSLRAKNPSARIIIITGYPTAKTAVQSMEFGAFEFLPKPFLPADIRGQVARALAALDLEGRSQGE
jgi:two-component system phosphate regulon sensor histidine kinase PhoR